MRDPSSFESFIFWYGGHWFLGLIIIAAAYALIFNFMRFTFLIIAFLIRQRNIKHQGWPPIHIDADGSFKEKEEDA